MAFRHGKFAEITVNSKALSVYTDSMDLNVKVDTSDTSTFTATWKTAIGGLIGAQHTISGAWDPTVTNGPAAVLTALIGQTAPFAVLAYPGGNIAGQISEGFNAILTDYKETSKTSGRVDWSATLLVTAAITFTPL